MTTTIKATITLVLYLFTIIHAHQLLKCDGIVMERIQTFTSTCISDDLQGTLQCITSNLNSTFPVAHWQSIGK